MSNRAMNMLPFFRERSGLPKSQAAMAAGAGRRFGAVGEDLVPPRPGAFRDLSSRFRVDLESGHPAPGPKLQTRHCYNEPVV